MLKLFPTNAEKDKYAKKEIHCSRFIPFHHYWNNKTLITKNNELFQVIKIGGFSFETADDEDLDIKKRMRNLLF